MAEAPAENCKRTPLFDLHVELGAKMVPFAGYDRSSYPLDVLKEHITTRENLPHSPERHKTTLSGKQ